MTPQPLRATFAHACAIAAVITLGLAIGLRASGHPNMQRIPMLAALAYGVLALLLVASCDIQVVVGARRVRAAWVLLWARRFRRLDTAHVATIQALAIHIAQMNHAGEAMARAYSWEYLHRGGRLGASYASLMLSSYTQARAAVLIDRARRQALVEAALQEMFEGYPARVIFGVPLTADDAEGIAKMLRVPSSHVWVPSGGVS